MHNTANTVSFHIQFPNVTQKSLHATNNVVSQFSTLAIYQQNNVNGYRIKFLLSGAES